MTIDSLEAIHKAIYQRRVTLGRPAMEKDENKVDNLQKEVDRLNAILDELVTVASVDNYEEIVFPNVWAVLVKHGLVKDKE